MLSLFCDVFICFECNSKIDRKHVCHSIKVVSSDGKEYRAMWHFCSGWATASSGGWTDGSDGSDALFGAQWTKSHVNLPDALMDG